MNVIKNTSENYSPFPQEAIEQSISKRFEQQVKLFPNRLAVEDTKIALSYTELNAMANRIAHNLVAHIGSDQPQKVVLYFEKSVEYIASIFAVLKTGHTYVPIDPVFPDSRNKYILANSDAKVVITNNSHMEKASILLAGDHKCININALPPDTSVENLDLKISPEALAYIIYTSGSTGKPKGVMQNHRNTLHGCLRRTNLQFIEPDDNITLFYSCSVMGAVYCIFGALLNGASLFPYGIREEGLDDLATWLKDKKITIYHSVASVFRQFARLYEGSSQEFAVRLVIFGGERVLTSDVQLARKVFSERIYFYTGLGSTETGTIRHYPITPDTHIESKVVPIGYEVDGVEIVLVDENNDPVPVGEVGEITVHSPYIALGYWKDETNTNSSFSHPDQESPVRVYRTGDMGQIDSSGLLRHKGRKDFQVKIRGFRVELGEIETALQEIAIIREAIVIAFELGGQTRLVAYLTLKEKTVSLTARDLRRHIQGKLPYYMIPSHFVALEEMPRTPNNKIDRNAFPLFTRDIALPDEDVVPADTDTENLLVKICQELLLGQDYSMSRSFFEHGGDSLSATQLVARVHSQLGVKPTMKAVFSAEDLRALAKYIDQLAEDVKAGTPEELCISNYGEQFQPPLSFAQRRMWLTSHLVGGSAAYNISNTVRLTGQLNVEALEKALDAIIERQRLLRTTILNGDQGPWLKVHPHKTVTLPTTDLRHFGVDVATSKALQIAAERLSTVHDLIHGPLFEYQLLRVSEDQWILVLVFNHIIYDNIWSSGLFFKELAAFYSRETNQQTNINLPELNVQFTDFSRWEQDNVNNTVKLNSLKYWQQQLAGLSDAMHFPSDFRRPSAPSMKGGLVRFEVPDYIVSGLKYLASSESATTFMILLTGWKLLLSRYAQHEDILVGTPTGRRHYTETEGLIGLFINNLVLRTDLSGDPSFREILRRVRKVSIDAFSHDELPFEKLVEELNPKRSKGVTPFFQHLFIHRNATKESWALPGLEVNLVELHPGGSKFDLTLSILENDGRIDGTIEYSQDLFKRESAERMVKNYLEVLGETIDQPDIPANQLNIVSASEKTQLLDTWNQTESDYPKSICPHQVFEKVAEENGEKVAVIADDRSLTYEELNAQSNKLARHLRTQGVKPNDLVAVCVNRSTDLVIALMAVLKSGGAYVPLDPNFPAERLKYMVENSEAEVVISQTALLERLPETKTIPILLDDGPRIYDNQPTENLEVRNIPTDLAYVIYTSGSTGKPKGVEINHQGLQNFLFSMKDQPGLGKEDIFQAITTICFDIAALEIFLPLIVGAQVVVSSRETAIIASRLIESIKEHGATILQATPITWRMLIEGGWRGEPKLKVLCGGEAMGTDLAEQLIETGCEVWNLYGPTETTIWSAVNQINKPEDATVTGRPIANTELYVCSPQLQLQPIGVPGELLIGGDGLARGYFKREDITTEKFIPNMFKLGKRLYRTGDMVTRRSNGDIEFLGRMDNQVKIRGFRIELGDIESHISSYPEVQHNVVIAREDTPGDKKLVAYLISKSSNEIEQAKIRGYLNARLPDYMVPTNFITLPEFPQTPNGKVDRKLLPAPSVIKDTLQRNESPSPNITIQKLMEIFENVTGNKVYSSEDNFFDLGGHSLLTLKAIDAINRHFGTDLSPAIIFDKQTVAELADVVTQSTKGELDKVSLLYPQINSKESVHVDNILAAISQCVSGEGKAGKSAPQMRESWLGKNVISKIYPNSRRFIKNILEFILLKIEGGTTYSTTIRKLFKECYNIEVGDFTSTRFVVNSLKENTKIGKFCSIVGTSRFQTADHPLKTLSTHAIFYHKKFGFTEGYELERKCLEIGNDVWIGDGARILYPTEKIGDGAVIASGAVVVEDVPPYAIVGGYPAQVLRYRFSKETIEKLLEIEWWNYPITDLHKVDDLFTQPLQGNDVR